MKLITTLTIVFLLWGCASIEIQPDENGETPPVLKYSPPIMSRIPGVALFEIAVGTDGKIKEIRILDTSNMKFAMIVADNIKISRYHPATRYGVPIESTTTRRIEVINPRTKQEFILNDLDL